MLGGLAWRSRDYAACKPIPPTNLSFSSSEETQQPPLLVESDETSNQIKARSMSHLSQCPLKSASDHRRLLRLDCGRQNRKKGATLSSSLEKMIARGLHVEVIIIIRMKIQNENTYSHEMAFWDIIDPFLLLTGGDLRWIGGRFQCHKHSSTALDVYLWADDY